jgi:hypothetical protein
VTSLTVLRIDRATMIQPLRCLYDRVKDGLAIVQDVPCHDPQRLADSEGMVSGSPTERFDSPSKYDLDSKLQDSRIAIRTCQFFSSN